MVTQEGAPSLARRPTSLDHVLGRRRLGDFKAELEQFAVDARCAQSNDSLPGRRLNAQLRQLCSEPQLDDFLHFDGLRP